MSSSINLVTPDQALIEKFKNNSLTQSDINGAPKPNCSSGPKPKFFSDFTTVLRVTTQSSTTRVVSLPPPKQTSILAELIPPSTLQPKSRPCINSLPPPPPPMLNAATSNIKRMQQTNTAYQDKNIINSSQKKVPRSDLKAFYPPPPPPPAQRQSSNKERKHEVHDAALLKAQSSLTQRSTKIESSTLFSASSGLSATDVFPPPPMLPRTTPNIAPANSSLPPTKASLATYPSTRRRNLKQRSSSKVIMSNPIDGSEIDEDVDQNRSVSELSDILSALKNDNDLLDRWGDLVESEIEQISCLVHVVAEAEHQVEEKIIRSITASLKSVQKQFHSDRNDIAFQTAQLVLQHASINDGRGSIGLSISTLASRSGGRNTKACVDFWEEDETTENKFDASSTTNRVALTNNYANEGEEDKSNRVYCFRALSRQHMRVACECELRIHSSSLRLVLSSHAWDHTIDIHAEDVLSVKQSPNARKMVTLVRNTVQAERAKKKRRGGSGGAGTVGEQYEFNNVVYARQFVRYVTKTLLQPVIAASDSVDDKNIDAFNPTIKPARITSNLRSAQTRFKTVKGDKTKQIRRGLTARLFGSSNSKSSSMSSSLSSICTTPSGTNDTETSTLEMTGSSDLSTAELSHEHVDLITSISDGLQELWRDDVCKVWFRRSSKVVGIQSISLMSSAASDTSGNSCSLAIALDYTSEIFRTILSLRFKVAQLVSDKRALSGPKRSELIQVLAQSGHAHWIRLASRMYHQASSSGIGQDRLPPRPPSFYKSKPFAELDSAEKEQHKADVKQVLRAISHHGFVLYHRA